MSRQSSYFGTATFTRAADLAAPAPACQKPLKEQQNLECLGGMRRPDPSVRAHEGYPVAGTRIRAMLAPNFSRLALLSKIFTTAERPSAPAVIMWPTCAGGGFNSWESQPRHRPRDPTPTSLRLGESLWRIGMPEPFCRLGSSWTWPMHPTTYRSVRLSGSSCRGMSVLGSPSSESSAWVASPHPTSRASLAAATAAFNVDEFCCEIYVGDPS